MRKDLLLLDAKRPLRVVFCGISFGVSSYRMFAEKGAFSHILFLSFSLFLSLCLFLKRHK